MPFLCTPHRNGHSRDFPDIAVIKCTIPVQGAWVQSLVGKLRFHMLHGADKIIIKKEMANQDIHRTSKTGYT